MGKKKCLLTYTVLFCVIFAGAFLAFLLYGKSFIWKSDGYRQYYPALAYIGKYYREIVTNILHGNFTIPMMDYTIGQGEDILTTFANYGLGDPLTLIGIGVPVRYTEYLYDFLVILRMYLSGVTFLIYCFSMKIQKKGSLVGALVYVFCGFAIWSVKDPFFLNSMIYLPLVLLGIEWVLKKKSPLLLAFSVLFSIISGYYFFYMIVICGVCYFVMRSYRYNDFNLKRIVFDGVRCLLSSLGGVLMSAIIFLPTVLGFLSSSRTDNHTPLSSFLLYDLSYYKNMFGRLFTVAENNDASVVGYLTMSFIILIALYVLAGKKEKKFKTLKWCVVISFAAAASPFVGFVMNGCGYITNRFMFVPAFLLSLVLAVVWEDLFDMNKEQKRNLWIIAAVYAVVCLVCSTKDGILQYVCSIIIAASMLLCIHFVKQQLKLERILFAIICLNLIVNGNLLYQKAGVGMIEAYENSGEGYEAYVSDHNLNEAKKQTEGSLERIDVMNYEGQNPNQAVVAGYHGISIYYSVINSAYSSFMMSVENAEGLMYTHRLLGNDGRTILENLANVAYVASKNKAFVPYGFEPVQGVNNLYKNTNKTSIGYTYESYVDENDYNNASVYERQNCLLDGAVVDSQSDLMKQSKKAGLKNVKPSAEVSSLAFGMTEVKHLDWVNGEMKIDGKNGSFSIDYEMESQYEYYIRFCGMELKQGEKNSLWANVSTGDMSKSFLISNETYDFFFGRSDYLVNIGSLGQNSSQKEKKTIRVRINGPAQFTLDNIELVKVSVDDLSERIQKLNKESLQNVRTGSNQLTGTITTTSNRILCIAVPYKQGYTMFVDGQQVSIDKVNKMYIGTQINKGRHDILLKYCTPGLKTGGILTIIGVIYTIILSILHKRRCA